LFTLRCDELLLKVNKEQDRVRKELDKLIEGHKVYMNESVVLTQENYKEVKHFRYSALPFEGISSKIPDEQPLIGEKLEQYTGALIENLE
jgi:hypothetical protein